MVTQIEDGNFTENLGHRQSWGFEDYENGQGRGKIQLLTVKNKKESDSQNYVIHEEIKVEMLAKKAESPRDDQSQRNLLLLGEDEQKIRTENQRQSFQPSFSVAKKGEQQIAQASQMRAELMTVVKRNKLVLVVDPDSINQSSLKNLLVDIGFRGLVECSSTTVQAVQYLNALRDTDGRPVSADLVFCTFDV